MDLVKIIRIRNPNGNKRLEVYNKDIVINITTLRKNKNIRSTLIIIIINYRL